MQERSTRGRGLGPLANLGLGLALGAIVLAGARFARAETRPAPPAPVASTSVVMEERSQEALARELTRPPFLPPETFTDLMNAVPAPVFGGLGVEVE